MARIARMDEKRIGLFRCNIGVISVIRGFIILPEKREAAG